MLGVWAINFEKSDYEMLIHKYGLNFPETGEIYADHIWLAPVVSTADVLAIENLLRAKIVNKKIVIDILY